MTQLTDLIDGGGDDYAKQPGEWRRKGENGPPIVTDPNGEANKTGANKGKVKLRTYSRPSNFGKQVENTFNLERWNERMVAVGMVCDDELIQMAHCVARDLDLDDPAAKKELDGVVVAAKRAAGAMIHADRGTHGHHLTEDNDLCRSIITRIEQGEDLGLSPELQHGIAEVWQRLIDEHFEVLAVEEPCVYDEWRVAGTLDRIVRLKHDLTFTKLWVLEERYDHDVTISAGTVLVLDIKTGGLKTDRDGLPIYWQSYAVQVAAYAFSVPYDVDTERRYEWPWPIDTDHAVIAHIDIAGALDTDVITAQLIYVDLTRGAEAGDLVCAAKDWQKRRDVFSPAGVHVIAHTIAAEPMTDAEWAPFADAIGIIDRTVVVARARRLVDAGHGLRLSYVWPDGIPGLKTDHQHTDAELLAIYDAICQVEDEQGMSPGWVDADQTLDTPSHPIVQESAPSLPVEPTPAPPAVDEGERILSDEYDALKAAFTDLPDDWQARIEHITSEANAADLSISLVQNPTRRRFEIARALIRWARTGLDEGDLSDLCACVIDAPIAASIPLGAAIGALTIDEAKRLADMVAPATVTAKEHAT